MLRRRVVLSRLSDGLKKKRKDSVSGYPRRFLNIKNKKEKYDYPERWITWLVGRWRTQLIARQRVNCRTHEHRHFERTLRSTDTIPGPRLAEGRSRNPNTACVAYRYSSYIWSFFSLFFCNPRRRSLKSNVSESGVKNRGKDKLQGGRCATYERLLDVRWRSSRSWPRLQNRNACASVWYVTMKNVTDLRECSRCRESSVLRNGWPPVFHRFVLVFNVISYPPLLRFVRLWITITYRAPNVVWN